MKWGCEGHAASLLTEENDGRTVKYYETVDQNGTKIKHYCDFDSRQDLEDAIQRRRSSLQRAMEIYMEEVKTAIILSYFTLMCFSSMYHSCSPEAYDPVLLLFKLEKNCEWNKYYLVK